MSDSSYQAKVYRKRGGDELVVAAGGQITIEAGGAIDIEGDLFTAFDDDDQTLVVEDGVLIAGPHLVRTQRFRVQASDVNAGLELLPAIAGKKYRLVDCIAIAVGGNAATVTTVDILGTQSATGVKLVAYAQANLTRSAVLRAGATGAAVLADGASFAPCDANTAITIGKTGSELATATHVDVLLSYTVEE